MPSAKHKLTTDIASYRLDFFAVRRHFVLRCAFSLTAACTIHVSWTCLCLPVIFADNSGKASSHDIAMWPPCGCVGISFHSNWQRHFSYSDCSLFVTQTVIGVSEAQWPPFNLE